MSTALLVNHAGDSIADSLIEPFRAAFQGMVIRPADADYDTARRIWNASIDRRPGLIVRCTGLADVIAAVNFGRDNHLLIAVRGGGHNVGGRALCDGGMVIDLSRMKGIHVDPEAKRVRVQPGVLLGELDRETHVYGMAVPLGVVSRTGVAGLTLGGGVGWLSRKYGLTCDNVLSFELVTADGEVRRVSADEHPDLFWALRGGGGNFGVVTSFEFQLHPVSEIYGGPLLFELEDAKAVLEWYRDFIKEAPEQFGGFPAWQIAPPLPFIPEDRHGEPFLIFVTCWAGPVEQGEQALEPLRDVAPVVAEMVGAMPYPALNSAFDALVPAGLQHYWKASFSKELTDEAITAHLEHGPKVPAVNSTVHIYPINGAAHRVAPDETAFAYRDATFATVIAGMWPDAAENDANTKWVRGFYDAIAPFSEAGGYINFMADDDQGRIKENY